jgi:diguanylate cyclase (GGDEF)-like protein
MEASTARSAAVALGALGCWLAVFEANLLLGFTPESGLLFGRPAHLVISFAAAVLCLAGALRRRGGERVAWILVAVGIAAWNGGDTYWTAVLLDEPSIPVPSPADAGYLAFPVLTFAGIASLVRLRNACAERLLWMDGLTAALATGAVAAAVVVDTVAGSSDGGETLEVATNLAYPLTDLILLGLVVVAVALRGWRLNRALALSGAAVVSFWIADTHYLLAIADGTYRYPDPYDLGWTSCFLLLAASSWQPVTAAAAVQHRGRRTAVLPLVFAAMSLCVLVYAGIVETSPVAVGLAGASLVAVGARLWMTFRDNIAMLDDSRREALTDALTGLGNRRALERDLGTILAAPVPARPAVLVLLDLDGFKHYNDSFGHPAGDALLVRLGGNLAERVGPAGAAYRMGGDEFCALIRPASGETPEHAAAEAAAALSEHGEGFSIGCSHGSVVLGIDTTAAEQALRLADQRMYAQKDSGRASAGRQSRDVLLRALMERNPDLGEHLTSVADLAVAVARRLRMGPAGVDSVRHAAELHDVGKVAIPDAILNKPAALDESEWAFMHRHTIIGERIVAAAPSLQGVAQLVRSSHERWDGTGYPDRLSGEGIPLGARIVAVCDAFDAMVADRPYRAALPASLALEELRGCAGSQFDPAVVEVFCEIAASGLDALPRAA